MAWSKGQSGNPKGRAKGKPNKTTKEMHNVIQAIVLNSIDTIHADLAQLEPKDRIDTIIKLLAYIQPKPLPTDVTHVNKVDIFGYLDGES